MAGTIDIERSERVAVVTIADPPLNPIGLAMVDRLEELISQLESDRDVRSVVIAGAGDRAFSVGANIRELGAGVAKMTLEGFIGQRHQLIRAIETMSKPVIAAISGLCLGGGLELALGCHFRIADRDAQLGLPEIDLGVLPAWGGTQRLVRTVGRARALDLALRGRRISGQEAHAIGLACELSDPAGAVEHALGLARELAEKAPLAVAAILDCTVRGGEMSLDCGLALERDCIARVGASRDAAEGIRAFLGKRKPDFHGE